MTGRFKQWDEVIVITACNLRAQPGGEIIEQLKPETRLVIVGGQRSADSLTWWQVNNGHSGWVAEESPGRAILIDRVDDSSFGKAMRFVLRHEGGLADVENDPGGLTLWGVSQRFNPKIDVRNMTLDQAKSIYRTSYWAKSGCDLLSWPMCLTVFDMAVNAGVGAALDLLKQTNDFDEYNDLRRAYYKRIPTFGSFGQGWMRRVDEIGKIAI